MKNSQIKVSIIVPCYNQEPYIEDCIKSLTNQTLKEIEILCVDDCSNDNTVKIIKNLAKKDSRIKLVEFKENLGTCMARKEAVKKSTGKYIMFCDSDDEYDLDACKKSVELIQKHNVDILQFGTNIINCGASETSMNWFTNFSKPLQEKITGTDVYFKCFKDKKYSFNLWNKIYNGDVVRKAFEYIKDGFFPKAQDMYAFHNIAYFAQSYYGVEEKLYNYYYGRGITANSKISMKRFSNISTQSQIIELLYKFIDDVNPEDFAPYLETILIYSTSFTNEIISNFEKIENLSENKKAAFDLIFKNLTPLFNIKDYKNAEIYDEYCHSLLNILNILFTRYESECLESYLTINSSSWASFTNKARFFECFGQYVPKIQNINKALAFWVELYSNSAYLLQKNIKDIVPIVFATNDNYAPYLSVALESLKTFADKNKFYDIYIFNSGLSELTKVKLKNSETDNINIRFVNVSSLIKTNALYERDYFSVEMYYRLLISEVLAHYEKVIYLDCDIVVLDDVSKMLNFDLKNKILGVVNDKVFSPGQKDYVNNNIKVGEDNYFNSGILIINTKLFTEFSIKEKCFEVLGKYKKLSCPDQDALNISCFGQVLYLPESWNFQNGRGSYTFEDRYYNKHNIVHYTSAKKPWDTKGVELGEIFWKFARKSIFYEDILSNFISNTTKISQPTIVYKNNDTVQSRNVINAPEKIHYPVINSERQTNRKKLLITWPLRMTKKFFASLKQDGFKKTMQYVKIKLKYIFNRLTGRVDKYNNDIIKYKPVVEKTLTDKDIENRLDEIIEQSGKKPKVIVSFTSYPARIPTIHKVVESVKNQTLKPAKIILWLADSQFPNKEKDLPKTLLKQLDDVFEIKWCEDIRSYKKLIPTIELYPDDYIATIDDDNVYSPYWLKRLYADSLKNPNCIIAHRITKFVLNDSQEFKVIAGGKEYYHLPSYLNKLVGAGGVLYPPHSLYKDICRKDLFWNLAQTNDDQWFWFMGVLNGYKVKVCDYPLIDLHLIDNTQETALCNINDHGENLFWIQFNNLINYYPQLKDILIHEYYNLAKNHLTKENFSGKFELLKTKTKEIEYNYYSTLPIEEYPQQLQNWYNKRANSNMDINNPQTYNEKIQWLKIHDATIIKSHLSDKWLAKEYIKSVLGEKYIIKTLGVYDTFNDIDFDKLPQQFVMKTTHGSGQIIIVRDKNNFNKIDAKIKFDKWLKQNFAYTCGLEVHYYNMIPRIIIEEYMESVAGDLYDYKIVCSFGKAQLLWVDSDRFTVHKRNIFLPDWTPMKYENSFPINPNGIEKPKCLKTLLSLAEKLSKDFALCRCDFYILANGDIKFGEFTFTSGSGFADWKSHSYLDEWLGEKIKLPKPTTFKKYTREELIQEENKFLKSLKKSR